MAQGSTKAVYAAITGNSIVMVTKFLAFFFTGSGAMLSEAIHSFADVSNQGLLAFGIRQSKKEPDETHPYGYLKERYIWALVSAVGIFFLGCGVTVYHGIHNLIDPVPLQGYTMAFIVLALSLAVEGTTLVIAMKSVLNEAQNQKMTLRAYLSQGADPIGVAVVLEDGAAVSGVVIAFLGLLLTHLTHDPIWDGIATVFIGLLMGGVAVYLLFRTRKLLIGQSIPEATRKQVLSILNQDASVEKVLNVKTAILGTKEFQFKADVEFDGEVIAENFLKNHKISFSPDDYEDPSKIKAFLVEYGDHLIQQLGDEVDRLEEKIRQSIPDIKYIDLETH